MELFLSLIGGLCMGFAGMIGFKPIWKQPNNLHIQLIVGVIGLMAMAAVLTTIE